MASVHRDPRSPRGVWYCRLTTADGRHVWRSTKNHNRRQAQIICEGWQQAEIEASNGQLTKRRAQQILNETLRRVGSGTLECVTIRTCLEDWLESKWSSLDLQYGILSYRERKLRRPAIVALHPDFIDWIAKQSVPDDPDAFVFPTLADRSGGGRQGLSQALDRRR